MIISCEHEVVGKDSILRIWPAQDPREGAELADTIESLSDIQADLSAAEDARWEAESAQAGMEEKLEEMKEAIQGAIAKLREINPKATNAEMISDATEARELLEGVL